MNLVKCSDVDEATNSLYLVPPNRKFINPKDIEKKRYFGELSNDPLSWMTIVVLILTVCVLSTTIIMFLKKNYYDDERANRMMEALGDEERLKKNMVFSSVFFVLWKF